MNFELLFWCDHQIGFYTRYLNIKFPSPTLHSGFTCPAWAKVPIQTVDVPVRKERGVEGVESRNGIGRQILILYIGCKVAINKTSHSVTSK